MAKDPYISIYYKLYNKFCWVKSNEHHSAISLRQLSVKKKLN